jgi:hypothetical protein
VITLIHRQETFSFLGLPLVRHIDIDDDESVLHAIRDTPRGRPIEIILHTPGGLVLAAGQIAIALADHDGPVTAAVPHYAMSGGTLIAMAADEIVMEGHAALGPDRRGFRRGASARGRRSPRGPPSKAGSCGTTKRRVSPPLRHSRAQESLPSVPGNKGVGQSFGTSFAPLESGNAGAGRRPARSSVSVESRSNSRGPCRIGARLVFRVAPAASGPARSPALCARWCRFIYPPLRS